MSKLWDSKTNTHSDFSPPIAETVVHPLLKTDNILYGSICSIAICIKSDFSFLSSHTGMFYVSSARKF
jgi:hypothetical protein